MPAKMGERNNPMKTTGKQKVAAKPAAKPAARVARKPKYTVSAKAREQRHAAGKRSAAVRKAEDKWLTCAVGATNKAWAVAAHGSVNEALTAFRRLSCPKGV